MKFKTKDDSWVKRSEMQKIWRKDDTLDELLSVEELGFMFLKSDFTPLLLFLADVGSPRKVIPSPRRV